MRAGGHWLALHLKDMDLPASAPRTAGTETSAVHDMTKKKIELFYFNAGGGHLAAAKALQAVIGSSGREWDVRLTNILEVLDPAGQFKRFTGMAPEDYYNKRLAAGMTVGLAQELKLLQRMIRLWHGTLARVLQQHLLRGDPDLVVSLIPNFNRPLCEAVSSALPGVPFVTVMTDIADYPPEFWAVPGMPQHLVCGSPRAMRQALDAGCAPERVHRVSGMILRPGFYDTGTIDVPAGRQALGFDPARPTGIVLFGGHGPRVMAHIAESLHDVQLILMCGHNTALARKLSGLKHTAPQAVIGFTPDVPRYMRLADFFIGKPGPGSLSEAVHVGLPVVTIRNTWTMPQERYNTEWVRDNGLGIVAKSTRALRGPVLQLLARLPEFKANVQQLQPNRAVFEIPGLLEQILEASAGTLSCDSSLLPVHRGQARTACPIG